MQKSIIHVRHEKRVLCGFVSDDVAPNSWPKGNFWVNIDQLKFVTCDACKKAAEALIASGRGNHVEKGPHVIDED